MKYIKRQPYIEAFQFKKFLYDDALSCFQHKAPSKIFLWPKWLEKAWYKKSDSSLAETPNRFCYVVNPKTQDFELVITRAFGDKLVYPDCWITFISGLNLDVMSPKDFQLTYEPVK